MGKEVIYENEVEVKNLKTELIVVNAFAQSIEQLFEARDRITDAEERALAHLKMTVSQCRKKYKQTKKRNK